MTNAATPSNEGPHSNPLEVIDRIVDQFRSMHDRETTPQQRAQTIHELIGQYSDLSRLALMLALLAEEIHLQQIHGQILSDADMLQLYPHDTSVVHEALHQYAEAQLKLDPGMPTEIAVHANGSEAEESQGRDQFPEITGYRIVGLIGRGGMGEVYRAVELRSNRIVAVKCVRPDKLGDPRAQKRFDNETRAAASLRHPNIVHVLGSGEDHGQMYYAMDHIQGQNLGQRIQLAQRELPNFHRGSSMSADTRGLRPDSTQQNLPRTPTGSTTNDKANIYPAPDFLSAVASGRNNSSSRRAFEPVVRMGAETAEALAYAHSMGVVHRDIKPANLLQDSNGCILVADFGLAQMQDYDAITMTGEVLGTYRYMSPEQLLGKRVVIDSLTDIYSLGATLYELLTLQPIRSGSREQILREIAFGTPARLRRLVPGIPRDLEIIVHTAIAHRPQDRYQSMQDFADDLRRFLAHEPIQATHPGLLKRTSLWMERNQKLSAVIGSAILLMLLILGFAWRHQARQTAIEASLKDDAVQQSKENKSLYLVASSHLERDKDPTLATLLAVEANKLHPSPEATAAFVMAMRKNHAVRSWKVRDGSIREGAMVVHPKHSRVVTTASYFELSPDHADLPAIESEISTGTVRREYDSPGIAIEAVWSPDGKYLLICSAARTEQDSDAIQLTWHLWNDETGKQLPRPLATVTTNFTTVKARRGKWPFGFSKDSQIIAIADETSVQRFRVRNGSTLPTTDLFRFAVQPLALTWTQSGNLAVVTADQELRVINPVQQTEINDRIERLGDADLVELHSISQTNLLFNSKSGPIAFDEQTLTDITPGYWDRSGAITLPNANSLFVHGTDGTPWLVDTQTLQPYRSFDAETAPIVSPGRSRLATLSPSIGTPHSVHTLSHRPLTPEGTGSWRFSSNWPLNGGQWLDENLLLTCSVDGRLSIHAADAPGLLRVANHRSDSNRTTVQSNPDSTHIIFSPVASQGISIVRPSDAALITEIDGKLRSDPRNETFLSVTGDQITQHQLAGTAEVSIRRSTSLTHGAEEAMLTSNETVVIVTPTAQLEEWLPNTSFPFVLDPGRSVLTFPCAHPTRDSYITVLSDGTVVERFPAKNLTTTLPLPPILNAVELTFSPNGEVLAVATDSGELTIYDCTTQESTTTSTKRHRCDELSFSSDSSKILLQSLHQSTGATVVSATDGVIIRSIDVDNLSRVVFSEDASELIYGCMSGLFRVPLLDTAEPIAIHDRPVIDLTVADGTLITIERTAISQDAGSDTTLHRFRPNAVLAYDLNQRDATPRRIDGIRGQPKRVRRSQPGKYVFVESEYWTADFASIPSADESPAPGRAPIALTPSPIQLNAPPVFADFLPQSNQFAAIDRQGTLQIWDLSTNELQTARIAENPVSAAAIARTTGDIFVSTVSNDLFRCGVGRIPEATQLNDKPGVISVRQLHPSPDGKTLAGITSTDTCYLSKVQHDADGMNRVTPFVQIAKNITTASWTNDANRVLLLGHASGTSSQITVYDCQQEASQTFSFDRIYILHAEFRDTESLVLLTRTGQIQLAPIKRSGNPVKPKAQILDIPPAIHFQLLTNDRLAVQLQTGGCVVVALASQTIEVMIPAVEGAAASAALSRSQTLVTPDGRWFLPIRHSHLWNRNPFHHLFSARKLSARERQLFRLQHEK